MRKVAADQKKGLTLMELMVTVAVSTIVLTLVLSSWDYLNKHVLRQENKSAVRDETARVTREIQLGLRRTPGVLGLAPTSVKFLAQDGGDTLEYAFDGEDLTKNGKRAPFNVLGGNITSFQVRSLTAETAEYLLLEVSVSSCDRWNNRDTSRFIVNAKNANAVFTQPGWDF